MIYGLDKKGVKKMRRLNLAVCPEPVIGLLYLPSRLVHKEVLDIGWLPVSRVMTTPTTKM